MIERASCPIAGIDEARDRGYLTDIFPSPAHRVSAQTSRDRYRDRYRYRNFLAFGDERPEESYAVSDRVYPI